MGEHNVPWCQRRYELLHDFQKRVVVRDKNLHAIAHLRDFRRCTQKVWHWPGRAIPNENVKAFFTKIRAYPAPDNTEADDANIFSRLTRHTIFWHAPGMGVALRESEVKPADRQTRSSPCSKPR